MTVDLKAGLALSREQQEALAKIWKEKGYNAYEEILKVILPNFKQILRKPRIDAKSVLRLLGELFSDTPLYDAKVGGGCYLRLGREGGVGGPLTLQLVGGSDEY